MDNIRKGRDCLDTQGCGHSIWALKALLWSRVRVYNIVQACVADEGNGGGARDQVEQIVFCKAVLPGMKVLSIVLCRENSNHQGHMLNRNRELVNHCLHKDPFKLFNISTI
jgi:hypothetical protein